MKRKEWETEESERQRKSEVEKERRRKEQAETIHVAVQSEKTGRTGLREDYAGVGGHYGRLHTVRTAIVKCCATDIYSYRAQSKRNGVEDSSHD